MIISDAYTYHVNLDERGEFYADVRNPDGQTVHEIHTQDLVDQVEYVGWMKHGRDVDGLKEYLVHLGIMTPGAELILNERL